MSSNNPSCYYHPSRDATTKCEVCGKLICVECKNVFQQSHRAGTAEHPTYYVTRHEVCTPCFYDNRIKAIKIGKVVTLILGIFFIMIGIIWFSIMYSFMSNILGEFEDIFALSIYMPLILFSCIGLIVILIAIIKFSKAPSKIADLEAKKAEFLKSVASGSSAKGRTQSLKKDYCPHCGSKINPGEKICEQCGGEL